MNIVCLLSYTMVVLVYIIYIRIRLFTRDVVVADQHFVLSWLLY